MFIKKTRTVFVVCICIIVLGGGSCTNIHIPEYVKPALDNAGQNKPELLKVIEHYSSRPSDSLKLRSVFYLITNMDGRFYYKGDLLNMYQEYTKLVLQDKDHGEYIMKSFNLIYGSFDNYKLEIRYDNQEITSSQLIENIEMAFKVWEDQPWGKDYNFEQFCEYILPFRIEDEYPEYNRREIYNTYNKLLDSVRKVDGSAIDACSVLNDYLKKDKWLFSTRMGFLPHFPVSKLLEYRVGSCREMADLATYVMRSCGVPVANDFVPQWPHRSMGHNWNVVLGKGGKPTMFLGTEDSPPTRHMAGTKKGKVYRRTFKPNQNSLAMVRSEADIIPFLFNDNRLLDVTDEYVKTFSPKIRIDMRDKAERFAYLCVFDNKNWVPVSWAQIKNETVVFKKMEGNIVYLPVYYTRNGVIPASEPFILDTSGEVITLDPDEENPISTFKVDRIFPVITADYLINEVINGQIQGANKPDFSDAITLFNFKAHADPFWNILPLASEKKYQYFRFLSSLNRGCHVAEIEIYANGKKVETSAFAAEGSYKEGYGPENIIDQDSSTSFSSVFTKSWVGLKSELPVTVDSIRLLPQYKFLQEKLINPGSEYELLVWTNNSWLSFGKKVAQNQFIEFKNVPSNGLYKLKNLTQVADERIFTYKSGKQIWW